MTLWVHRRLGGDPEREGMARDNYLSPARDRGPRQRRACTSTRSRAPPCSTPSPRSSSPRPSRPDSSPSTCSPRAGSAARRVAHQAGHPGGARVDGRGGRARHPAVHHREPPAGRGLDRPQVRPQPDADARPGPGGQHRPDPRGREVRLHQGLQVLDVRHLVGASGDHPRHRAAGARRAPARPRGRGDQPGQRRPPHARASAAAATRSPRRSPPSSTWTSSGSST